MKIPGKVKIGPHIYAIKYEKDFVENHSALAQSRHHKTTIVLDPEQSQSQLEDSFIHEILHCINNQIEFSSKEKDAEESSVSKLSPALLQLVKDNKKIFK